ncbi:alpha/beta hydrolase [Sphingopyxis sp.]|uniref:alpha/beta hydrolase n=1 Tax=Sphingopyxis sp. TaxID=1908224 RepID=UPI003D6D1A2F
MIGNSQELEADGLHGRLVRNEGRPASLIVCVHGGGCSGRYFDLPSFSFAGAALGAGHAVLMVDRPGHGMSPPIDGPDPIYSASRLLTKLVGEAVMACGDPDLPVAAFGHSIGGAVTMHWAAQSPPMLKCLATSGIGSRPTDAALAWLGKLHGDGDIVLPQAFFFGPDGSFDWRAPIALRKSGEPWRKDDVDEVLLRWPDRFAAVASCIRCPVLAILSEHERIWENDENALKAMRDGFAPGGGQVEIAAGGGHLYEVHRSWSVHAERIIAFIEGHIE